MPIRLVRGSASPEELSAVIAVVAVLASANREDEPGETNSPTVGSGWSRPEWSSPGRMVRMTHHHGPGGWRASAAPR
jgi:hypothetical protein